MQAAGRSMLPGERWQQVAHNSCKQQKNVNIEAEGRSNCSGGWDHVIVVIAVIHGRLGHNMASIGCGMGLQKECRALHKPTKTYSLNSLLHVQEMQGITCGIKRSTAGDTRGSSWAHAARLPYSHLLEAGFKASRCCSSLTLACQGSSILFFCLQSLPLLTDCANIPDELVAYCFSKCAYQWWVG